MPDSTQGIDYSLLLTLSDLEPREQGIVQGFWVVCITFVLFLIILPLLMRSNRLIAVYRPYEERLLKLNRLSLEDLLNYHSQFNWGNYASIAIGMVLLSVTLMVLNNDALTSIELTIQSVIVVVMAIATILLTFGDLIHTNSQTPIIPIQRRFKLIDVSVQFGTFGTILLVFSVLLFTCLISLGTAVLSCITFIGVITYAYGRRRIRKENFFRYFGIVNPKLWLLGGEGLGKDDKKNKVFARDAKYIRDWPATSKESFYQKMSEGRSISVALEEWLQEMIVLGLEPKKANTLRKMISKELETANLANVEDAHRIDRLRAYLQPFMGDDSSSDELATSIIKTFSDYFTNPDSRK